MFATATAPADRTVRPRILLVEDDEDQGRLMTRWLHASGGFEVAHLRDGRTAERRVRQEDWDLVISDIRLPGMDGLELARRAKERKPWMPVLLLTAHASVEYATEAVLTRADDFLVKPVGRGSFIEKAAALIRRSESGSVRRPRSILAVGAHPLDVELGCGGTLVKSADRGDYISVLTLCGGPARRGALPPSVRVHARGDLQPGTVGEGPDTIRLIEAVLRESGASVLYVPSAHDMHPDRRNAHRAAMVAARNVPNVYGYQTATTTMQFHPGQFVDVTDALDDKLAMVADSDAEQADPSVVRATATYWGRFANHSAVEPMEVIRATP